MTIPSLKQLRRDATRLKKAWAAGTLDARQRLANYPPRQDLSDLKHADFLHVIARENAFESWPKLVWAAESVGLDRAARQQRLKVALANGQNFVIERLLEETPDLPKGDFGLLCALYEREAVAAWLQDDPTASTRQYGPRRPMCHLAFSKYIHLRPDLEGDMLAVAELLKAHGAEVNDSMPVGDWNDHQLSALYGAIGHANNMPLGRWLLDNGADPNDGESLYHSTELGHHDGLKMLLAHGANPKGTNALLRAMDFQDVAAVRLLLDHGAKADDFDGTHVGGEEPWVVPALHQAARRMCGREMIDLLLDNGADPSRIFEGATAYGFARVFGNRDLSQAIEAGGEPLPLSDIEDLMVRALDGRAGQDEKIDPRDLPEAYRNIIRVMVGLPGKLDQIKRLIDIGIEFDRPDSEGLTPVQVAGWEGLPDAMAYLLSLGPDLEHINNYGGTLLGTIIHGSENCPQREGRDYPKCMNLALEAGLALQKSTMVTAAREDISAILNDWAEEHPEAVI